MVDRVLTIEDLLDNGTYGPERPCRARHGQRFGSERASPRAFRATLKDPAHREATGPTDAPDDQTECHAAMNPQ